MIICCHVTNREIRKTSKVCYEFLLDQPDDSILVEKLLILARHSSLRYSQISAVYIFDVTIKTLFYMLAVITQYVIVLLQLNYQK